MEDKNITGNMLGRQIRVTPIQPLFDNVDLAHCHGFFRYTHIAGLFAVIAEFQNSVSKTYAFKILWIGALLFLFFSQAKGQSYVLDQFNAIAYNNNDGSASWETNWGELSDDGLPNSGDVLITSNYLKFNGAGNGAFREIDLSAESSAILTFDFLSVDNGNDNFLVEVSANGGTNYTVLEEILPTGTGQSTSKSYALEDFITLSADVVVRFSVSQGFTNIEGQFASVDNVRIDFGNSNSPPIAFDDVDNTPINMPIVMDVLANDIDLDGNIDSTSVLIILPASNGGTSINIVTGAITYTPDPDFNGNDFFSYQVCDTEGACDQAEVLIKVGPLSVAQKFLYLTDPTQGLDRIDPVATADNTTSSTADMNAIETAAVADNFDVHASYAENNNTGSLTWSGDWIENDAQGLGAGSGNLRSSTGTLYLADNNAGDDVYRETDLSTVSTAIFSFDYTVVGLTNVNDMITVEASNNGGSGYTALEVFDQNTPLGTKSYDLIAALGSVSGNTRIRFRVSSTGGSSGNASRFDNISIDYTATGNNTETFSQVTSMCSPFSVENGETITVTAYATVTSGTMPGSPDVDAVLQYGASPTNIISLSNPTWDGSKFTWTGTMGSTVVIPSGEAISLVITTNESVVTFTIDYDSQTKPSKIQLPTTTYINIDAFEVYDAAYPGGSPITSAFTGTTVYLRSEVSDPFTFTDITGFNVDIIDPILGVIPVAGTSVAASGCTRTYEYSWTTPVTPPGNYDLAAVTNEGTEGVTDVDTISLLLISPSEVTVTKTLDTPLIGPYTLNDNLSYTIDIENTGSIDINSVPLQDIFNNSCLQFDSAVPAPDNISGGNLSWTNLGALIPAASTSVTVNFTVIANCDPARNIAKVEGAIDANSVVVALDADTVDIIIDEPPVVNDDEAFLSTTANIDVLANDTDPDGDMTTVTVTVQPPVGKGTANVQGDNTIQFIPGGGLLDDETITFTYQVCDNASPTPFCDDAVVTVTYSNFNDAPVIANDADSTTSDLPFIIDVLANDSDVDGNLDIVSMTITSGPTFGMAVINPDGSILYTPNPGFDGLDSLTYQICDDGFPTPVKCGSATVYITVIGAYYGCISGFSDLNVPAVPGALGYNWTLPAGSVITGGAGTNNITVDWSGTTAGLYTVCVEPTNDCGPGTQQCVELVLTEVMLSTNPTDILCRDGNSGAIDLMVTGGVPDFTYAWAHGASIEDLSGLMAGTYSVTVTDVNGCFASINETLTQPAQSISISGVITDEDPSGSATGAIDMTVSGGTPGYAYSWSNGASIEDLVNLNGGTFFVTVTDDNGCTETQFFTVEDIPAPLTLSSLTGTDVTCFGGSDGSVNLEVYGVTKPYFFNWSNGATTQDLVNVPAGSYNVTITDSSLPTASQVFGSIMINEPSTGLSASTTFTDISCNGANNGTIDLTVSGGTSPYTFLWSNGEISEDVTNLAGGIHTVTVTDANFCTTTASETITDPGSIEISATVLETSCDPGNTGSIDITPGGGSPGYMYSWSNGASSQDITGLTAGSYSVTVSDLNSCTAIASYVIETACIGVAKEIASGPVNNGDGTYTLSYDIRVENKGTVNLENIQPVDNLITSFAASTGYTVDNLSVISQPGGSTWTVNPNYDGDDTDGDPTDITDDELLITADSLLIGAYAILRATVTITPGLTLGVYNNSANATGQAVSGVNTSDLSQDGSDVDPDSDGSPGNNNVQTPVTFTESPQIGLAKRLSNGPINNNDGTYTLSYRIKVENTGDVILSNVQVVDNLAATFPGLTLSAVSASVAIQPPGTTLTANGSYNGVGDTNLLSGANSLNAGQYGELEISLTVALNGGLGPFDNTATTSALSPAGVAVNDTSHIGSDVDPDNDGPGNDNDTTPVTFTESPVIGLAKAVSGIPVNNNDGTYTLTYKLRIENTGDVPLSNVQIDDNLTATFPGLTLSAVSASISTQPLNTTFTANGSYNGDSNDNLFSGANLLNPGEYGIAEISLTVELNGNLGPFNNTATASGIGLGGSPVNDTSHDGSDPDPEADGPGDNSTLTPVTFTEDPGLGLAKTVSSQTNNNDGTYKVTYSIIVENTGDVPINNVQISDNLALTFLGASFVVDNVSSNGLVPNFPGYDGSGDLQLLSGTDLLASGERDTLNLTVTVTPGTNLGPYDNTANATGISSGGEAFSDDSWNGTVVDPDSDGDPTNNASLTPVSFFENPQIGTAKRVIGAVIDNGNDTYTLTYEIRVENAGDGPLNNLQVVEDLGVTFEAATGFTVDSYSVSQQPATTVLNTSVSYNGLTNTNLLNGSGVLLFGEFGLLEVTVTVTPGSVGGSYENSAIGIGNSPGGASVIDFSENGTDVDPDNDGLTSNNSTPTPVTFFENPLIGLAKDLVSVVDNGDGTNDVTLRLIIENFGDVSLDSLKIFDDIINQFSATFPSNFSATDGSLFANALWDGQAGTNILSEGQSIAIGAVDSVFISFRVITGIIPSLDNLASTDGFSPGSLLTTDISTDGLDPDGTDNDDTPDEMVPTPVPFILEYCPTATTNPHILYFRSKD